MKHLLVGLVLAGLGAWGLVTWWNVFGLVMRGLIPFSLLVLGLVAIFAGYRKGAQESKVESQAAGASIFTPPAPGNGAGVAVGDKPAADPLLQ